MMTKEELKVTVLYMKSLALMIRFHQHDYYQGKPRVSDYEFDMMFQELAKLEEQHPKLITYQSPITIVGH